MGFGPFRPGNGLEGDMTVNGDDLPTDPLPDRAVEIEAAARNIFRRDKGALAAASITRFWRSPMMAPGQIALTRIPSGPASAASDSVRPSTPRLQAE